MATGTITRPNTTSIIVSIRITIPITISITLSFTNTIGHGVSNLAFIY